MSPEQQKELAEKLQKMSPEELAEFQKQQCIFCQIIQGNIPSRVVFKDEKVTAVLDINPATDGHILVLPNEHYAVMPQMKEEDLRHLFKVVRGLSQTCIKTLGVEGTSIFAANGPAAGQRANHFMVHVIPRTKDDGVPLSMDLKDVTHEKLDEIKRKLSAWLKGETAEEKKEEKKEEKHEEKKEDGGEKKEGGADLDAIASLLNK